jgi:hypothetical protein
MALYSAKQSQARKFGRAARNLGKAKLEDDSGSDSDGTYLPEPSTSAPAASRNSRPLKKRKRNEASPPRSPEPTVLVSLASGIDPVDFTTTRTASLDEISTIAKIKAFVSTHFHHELTILKAPAGQLKLLAYRFNATGDTRWNAWNTQAELTKEVRRLKGLAEDAVVKMQVYVLEEDGMDMAAPLLLGRGAGKMAGEILDTKAGPAGKEDDDNGEEEDEGAAIFDTKENWRELLWEAREKMGKMEEELEDLKAFKNQTVYAAAKMEEVAGEKVEAEEGPEIDDIEATVQRMAGALKALARQRRGRYRNGELLFDNA